MSLKRPRIHQCGYANIDFRSKCDLENLKLYESWKIPKDFGSMGKSNYYPSYTEAKNIFSVSKSVNRVRDITSGCPDPKTYPSILYYKKKNIKSNIITDFREKRDAELDETDIGKERYTGDSMMISDIYKIREKRKNLKKLIPEKETKHHCFMTLTEKGDDIHKKFEGETLTPKHKITMPLNKIDFDKLQKTISTIKERLNAKKDLHHNKVFREWDRTATGEVTLYDLHEMINKMNIPINFNEVRALITNYSERNKSDSLNEKEFLEFIDKNDKNLQKEKLKNFEYKEEKEFKENKKEFQKLKRDNIDRNEIMKTNNIYSIKQLIKARINVIKDKKEELKIDMKKCSKEDFIALMKTIKIEEKYYRPVLLDNIFNTYLNKDNITMDMEKLCQDCEKIIEENNIYKSKDVFYHFFDKKINEQLEDKEKTVKDLAKEKKLRLDLIDDLGEQIRERLEIEKKNEEIVQNNMKQVINTQPSTNFINNVFRNHYKMFQELNRVEDTFNTKPNLVGHIIGKTRFNGNPPHKDTFYMINQDPRGSSYISEKERFNCQSLNSLTDFIAKEKEEKRLRQLAKLRTLQRFEQGRDEACKTYEKVFEQRDLSYQNKRTIRQNDYEVYQKYRNQFDE